MRRTTPHLAVAALALAYSATFASAQETHIVRFPAGASGTTIDGALTGDNYIDYRLSVSSGQVMTVRLEPATVYFNILPPGSDNESIFTGSIEGDAFSGTLSIGGTYAIRVYQMGAAASEDQTHRFLDRCRGTMRLWRPSTSRQPGGAVMLEATCSWSRRRRILDDP
jgi:hypothetical protein